jgi:meiotically up-regulated gene 157 (Mug157) protein
LHLLRDRLLSRKDAATGLYSSLQDAQDEFQKLPFITYDNVITWRALIDLAQMFERLHEKSAGETAREAAALRAAIMAHTVVSDAPGASGSIFASATDGHQSVETEIPPGALMKLPLLGFISEDDPLFARTYEWLHSTHYKYSYAGHPYGLPGSYRLPFTTSWMIADELRLKRSSERAEKILLSSGWDGGIVSEGINPDTAVMEPGGGAFATAAGYIAHAICEIKCRKEP